MCMLLTGKLWLKDQEESGNCNYAGVKICMTRGFKEIFGAEAERIGFTSLAMILERYPNNADYLQVFEYHRKDNEVIKFWCINDGDYITFLLPSEY